MKLVLFSVFALTGLCALGAEPLFMRHAAISPDGSKVAFSYKGDIYTVQADGGLANRLTADPHYDAFPQWSPDGSQIAFGSYRDGSLDVYLMNADGGTPRRLTTASTNETPTGWLNDSTVIYSASVMPSREALQGQFMPQTYVVSTTTGHRPVMLYSVAMPKVSVNRADGRIVYQDKKGFENAYRKHERSSGTADIWLIEDGKFTRLTDFNGHDMNPQWAGDEIVYLSETDGTLNVWSMKTDGSEKHQLTNFEKNPVRDLTRADDGTLAFFQNGNIYTMKPGGEPRVLSIDIVTDDYDLDRRRRFATSGADNTSINSDATQVAFTVRGDLYVTNDKYRTTKRITNTRGQERVSSFAPDGRTIYYDSERDGQWGIYATTIVDEKEKSFPYATEITEKVIYLPSDGAPAQQPAVSPDGKKVAFLEDRTALKVIDIESGKVTTALAPEFNYSYSDGDVSFTWSPDSRWLLSSYIGVGGWNNIDVALVAADGSQVVDLTESGYSDGNPRWALDGRAITYESSRYGMRSHGSWGEQSDVMLMVLDGETWDKFNLSKEDAEIAKKAEEEAEEVSEEADKDKKKSKKDKNDDKADKEKETKPFDLENRRYRIKRLTPGSAMIGDYVLSADGSKLYYTAPAVEGDYNLYERDLKKGDTQLLAEEVVSFDVDDKVEHILAFASGGLFKISLEDGSSKAVQYDAEYDRHPSAEREYIYDHAISQVRDKFYDAGLHGVDWDYYAGNYRRFLPHVNNNYDFADLLSELLGELNASHTGSGYHGPGADMETATLGAFYDETYQGNGLKIAEVIARGPLSTAQAGVKAGDVITAINGHEITPGTDINVLLDGRAGRKTLIDITAADGQKRQVTVKPTTAGNLSGLLYQRWVERNQALVDSLSGGRLAYVHVEGMNSPSFREVYSQLLGKYRNREAVIVDTRYNGGGWLHNDIALLLSGKEYVRYNPRGRYIGSDPFSQWTKPSVMLVNEANYSDAHGTPYTYQTLGIGDIVGAPVPGTMTAVWWETQIDPTLYFGIPQVTSLDRNGKALENQQLNPDILVYTNPGDIIQGHDAQLEKAVEVLLNKLDKK